MSWKTRKHNQYYYKNVRHGEQIHTLYFGRGRLAAAVAWMDARARRRRIKDRQAIRESAEAARRLVNADRQRIIKLGEIVDRAMRAAGFHKHHGSWRRRGVITMRTINRRPDDVRRALERELARRHFEGLGGDELAAEIDRYNIEMSAVALDLLISRITSDPYQQEACRRRVEQVETELAGDNASPLVRLLARSIAILRIEKYLADMKFYELLGIGLGSAVDRAVLRWREVADRRLNATIRTLAYVRKIDGSEIERTLEPWKVVG